MFSEGDEKKSEEEEARAEKEEKESEKEDELAEVATGISGSTKKMNGKHSLIIAVLHPLYSELHNFHSPFLPLLNPIQS